MDSLTIIDAKANFNKLASLCISNNDVFSISTKKGNVILMSEKHYTSLIETLYLMGSKEMLNDIEEAIKTPTSELIKKSPFE